MLIKSINFRKRAGQFSYRLVGKNNEVIAASERFTTRAMMLKSINRWNVDTLRYQVPVIECNGNWKPL
jgi:uncharacterized protein YegP (UPF0339 family)